MNDIKLLCVDWPLPGKTNFLHHENISSEYGIPISNALKLKAAFLKSVLWIPGQKIKISFIDSNAPVWKKKWVEKVIIENLQPVVNLVFDFGDYGMDGDIRVTFKNANSAFSRLGTESLYKSDDQPESLNLGWVDPPYSNTFNYKGQNYTCPSSEHRNGNDVGGTIIHEFGHAIGMIHEHQNPKGNKIQWNKKAVYDQYKCPPNNWAANCDNEIGTKCPCDDNQYCNDSLICPDTKQINSNILDRYDESTLNASQFDPKSIMLYGFTKNLTLNGYSTSPNSKLSKLDIEWIQNIYGDKGYTVPDIDKPTNISRNYLLGIIIAIIIIFLIIIAIFV
jgi:hypothetical protein